MSLLDPELVESSDHVEGAHQTQEAVNSRLAQVWRRLRQTPRFWLGAIALLLITLWALFGLAFYPWSATDQDGLAFSQGPSASHWFGTNGIGQDLYAQTIVGLQKSLLVGLIVGPTASLIAGFVGATSGYVGGRWDRVIIWFIDLLLVLPSFYILVLLSPTFKDASIVPLILFLALFGWMVMARVVRGQTMSLREREYVKAARYMGIGGLTIVRRHIIPNVASLLIIDATLGVGAAILAETALSFFGFGIQPPDVSLGTLLSAGSSAAVTRPWLFVFPSAVLILTVLATSLIGDALRDAVDPTSGATRD
jgi:peptide/nickel transport system permease protein